MRERFVQFDPRVEGSKIEQERNQVREALLQHVELSLHDPDFFVGKGSIARVVKLKAPGQERMICAKFIDTSRTEGTIDYGARMGEAPEYNDLGMEAALLDTLRDTDPDVRVPEPYYFWQKTSTVEGVCRTKSFLVMELLDAVTIEDVLSGTKDLPENFDRMGFFTKLRRFMERMHAKGIDHCDVHEGNIMIDATTGYPRVIDFGASIKGRKEGEQTEWMPSRGEKKVVSDGSGVDRLEGLLKEFLTNSKNSV